MSRVALRVALPAAFKVLPTTWRLPWLLLPAPSLGLVKWFGT
jgi:hypothetical protein